MVNNKFRFWLPAQILEKGGKGNDKVMRLGGIASTEATDTDGQNLIPSGFDISYLKSRGFINWNHKKSPDDIIGEPSKAMITKSGLYVEADLYPDSDLAKRVYKLANVLKKNSSKRRLGFSIEGKAIECDPLNPNKVTKAMITNIAITPSPKNPTSIIDIVKGDVDWRTLQEAINTEDDEELMPEEVIDDLKILNDKKKKEKPLSKGEVYDYLFDNIPVITIENAGKFYKKIKQFAMATKKKITNELLEKAIDALDLNKGIGEDEKTKGGKEEEFKKAKRKKKREDEEEEEEEENEEELEKRLKDDREEEEEEDNEEEEEPEEEDNEEEEEEEEHRRKKNKKKKFEKGMKNDFALAKILGGIKKENKEAFKAVGILLKGVMDEVSDLREENELMKGQLDELGVSVTGTHEKIDQIAFSPVGRKSISKAIERPFEKGMNNGIGGSDKVLSISKNKSQILKVLDDLTFEKGMDAQLADDLQRFEVGGTISSYGVEKIKGKGITLVN